MHFSILFQFHVHKLILQLSAPQLHWTTSPPPLSGLKEDVLAAVLHYLYNDCLCQGLTEETATQCIKVVGKLPGMENFVTLCQTFIKNTALKQRK